MSAKQKPLKTEKNATTIAKRSPLAQGGVDWPEINRVLDFMVEHDLEEFEYGSGDLHIRLKRPGTAPVLAHAPVVTMPAASPVHAPAIAGSAAASRTPAPAPAPAEPSEDLHTIKSPIVGTYYASPNPESPAFVKVGDRVSVGQVLCIIEAMKLMNEIEADAAGEIVKIFPANGHPVEYGEPLFAIRTK